MISAMTKSLLFESIQQSPIDPLFENLSDEAEGSSDLCLLPLVAGDETPQSPPKETPMMPIPVRNGGRRLRLIDSRAWQHQIGEGVEGPDVLVIPGSDGGLIFKRKSIKLDVGLSGNGLHIRCGDNQFTFGKTLPNDIASLYFDAYSALSVWRARIVRLSMESDEFECSLMDDLYPPRTFLIEYKSRSVLKSLKIQDGVSFWETAAGRVISVPSEALQKERDITRFMHRVAPELSLVDAGQVWEDFVQLRAMCLDEDRRLSKTGGASKPSYECLGA